MNVVVRFCVSLNKGVLSYVMAMDRLKFLLEAIRTTFHRAGNCLHHIEYSNSNFTDQ